MIGLVFVKEKSSYHDGKLVAVFTVSKTGSSAVTLEVAITMPQPLRGAVDLDRSEHSVEGWFVEKQATSFQVTVQLELTEQSCEIVMVADPVDAPINGEIAVVQVSGKHRKRPSLGWML